MGQAKVTNRMSDEFTHHFFRYFIAKMANNISSGNEQEEVLTVSTISESTLDILADVSIYYLTKLAHEIRQMVELSGRTEPNGYDVFKVLRKYRETIISLSSFIVDRSVRNTSEVTVRDYPIAQPRPFVNEEQEYDVFPYRANAVVDDSELDEMQYPPHIPRFFPMPEDMDDGLKNSWLRKTDGLETLKDALKERRQVEPIPAIKTDCPLVDEIIKSIFYNEDDNKNCVNKV